MSRPLSIAIPKGRLFDSVVEHLSARGMNISFGSRKLTGVDSTGRLEVYKVKNHDLPAYIHHGIAGLGIVGDDKRLVKTAAVCAGSCGKIINSIIAAKADCYVTGELKHHQALAAQETGLTCICLSHTVSERFILKKFAKQLQKQISQVKIKISTKDQDPFKWKEL